jgi:hypothetical protein
MAGQTVKICSDLVNIRESGLMENGRPARPTGPGTPGIR